MDGDNFARLMRKTKNYPSVKNKIPHNQNSDEDVLPRRKCQDSQKNQQFLRKNRKFLTSEEFLQMGQSEFIKRNSVQSETSKTFYDQPEFIKSSLSQLEANDSYVDQSEFIKPSISQPDVVKSNMSQSETSRTGLSQSDLSKAIQSTLFIPAMINTR